MDELLDLAGLWIQAEQFIAQELRHPHHAVLSLLDAIWPRNFRGYGPFGELVAVLRLHTSDTVTPLVAEEDVSVLRHPERVGIGKAPPKVRWDLGEFLRLGVKAHQLVATRYGVAGPYNAVGVHLDAVRPRRLRGRIPALELVRHGVVHHDVALDQAGKPDLAVGRHPNAVRPRVGRGVRLALRDGDLAHGVGRGVGDGARHFLGAHDRRLAGRWLRRRAASRLDGCAGAGGWLGGGAGGRGSAAGGRLGRRAGRTWACRRGRAAAS